VRFSDSVIFADTAARSMGNRKSIRHPPWTFRFPTPARGPWLRSRQAPSLGLMSNASPPFWDVSALVSMMLLSNSERLIVDGFHGRARPEALFRYWTRKDAILKATSHGLAVSPASITISSPYHAPELLIGNAKMPVKAAFLYDLDAGPGHVASLATLDVERKISENQANDILAKS